MKISNKMIDRFKEALSSEGLRFTQQRLSVLSDMMQTNRHRDCEEIYDSLQNNRMEVSKATVYRTLDVLTKHGFIRQLDIGDGAIKYEKKIGNPHHDHMICIKTGRIIEFVDDRIEKIQDDIARKKGYKIIKHVHQLFVTPLDED